MRLGSGLRRAGRRTNLALLILLGLALGSGTLAFAVGTPSAARVVTVAHGALGLALLLLVPWKSAIAGRGMRRPGPRRGRVAGVALAVLVAGALASGVWHALGGYGVTLGVTPMQVHVGTALLAVPFAVGHVLAHRPQLRRTDLTRRWLLRTGALGGGSLLLYAAGEATASVLDLPGADRRATGSHEVGSGRPESMPVTQWFTDSVPTVDVEQWRLRLVIGAMERLLSYDDVAAGRDVVAAVLDCTGGWYAEQEWRGLRLDRLVAGAPGRSIEVVSVTGYRRRFPITDAPHLLLATSVAGLPLSAGHGAPVRLVAPGRRGFWWVKWVERVEVDDLPWWVQPPFPLQ